MRNPVHISRPNRKQDAKHVRSIRDLIAASIQILKDSRIADTFLGRKTLEPFPQEKGED